MEDYQDKIKDKYLKVKELLEVKYKTDPDSDPFKSKYEARDTLKELEALLKEKEEKTRREKAIFASIYALLGTICMDVDEPTPGENYLHLSLKLVENEESDKHFVLTTLCTLNQLALLYSMRQEDSKALIYLERAENLYKEFKEFENGEQPLGYHSLFVNYEEENKKGSEMFEKTHTLTLYYLAQVHKALGKTIESAVYCHNTLRRQLETDDYDKIDWALNSAALSQYFSEQNAFKEARHHLAAASFMLSLHKKELDEITDKNEEYDAKCEKYMHRKSDVYRCWIKYCLNLLSKSKDRLMASDEEPTPIRIPHSALIDKRFPSLDVDSNEKMVSCNYLLTIEDAKPVALFGQSCVNKAVEYYSLQDHASDYVLIIQDSSQLYMYLAFFEEDDGKKCKLHKKRKDMLKKTVCELNETYYLDVCREIWLEMGLICSSIAEIKAQKYLKSNSAHSAAKLNSTLQESINFLTKFIKSFIDKKTNKTPERYPIEFERDILMAHLCTAQVHSKFVNQDKSKTIEFVKESLHYYEAIVKYCIKNPDAAKDFLAELGIAKDMVTLLPIKMTKLAAQL